MIYDEYEPVVNHQDRAICSGNVASQDAINAINDNFFCTYERIFMSQGGAVCAPCFAVESQA